MNSNLRKEIIDLISLKSEGSYWDFKEKWHSNNSDLVHDIICMANSPANRDCYLIIGVRDITYEIIGAEGINRKNQQNVIDLLHNKPVWAGGYIPEVYVKTEEIDEKNIDIIVINRSDNTPFYLLEEYKDGQSRPIYKGVIYTRKGDTNTSRTSAADISDVEVLWKRRFGLLYNPSQRALFYLKDLENWERVDGGRDKFGIERFLFYYKLDPDYTINLEFSDNEDETFNAPDDINDERVGELYYYLFSFCNISYHTEFSNSDSIALFYRDIPLFSSHLETIDEGRTRVIPPEFVSNSYYIKDSLRFHVFEFVFYYWCGNYSQEAKTMFLRVIPLYKNQNEYEEFNKYVQEKGFTGRFKMELSGEALNRIENISIKLFDSKNVESKSEELLKENDLVVNFASHNNKRLDEISRYLKIGKMLVDWLEEWRRKGSI